MRILAIAVVAALAVAGCKEKHSSSAVQTNGDETVYRPDIEFESPIPDEKGVALTAVVLVRFSEPMNVATINTGTFIVRDPLGAPIAGVITYNTTTDEATFTPSAPLAPFATYTASLAASISSVNGVSLGVGHAWLFTTGP
ncbi:MAG: Ig-like domain-containing protein [Planctomycetia bacterium]|nr:Ig-like domain-containing protein [Planctomycetia bacterium]